MSSEKGPKYNYTQEHKLYYYYHERKKYTEKKKATKQSEEYIFFHQCFKKTSTNTLMASRLHGAIFLIVTFYWLISAGQNTFYPAKLSILARKMRRNARLSNRNSYFSANQITFMKRFPVRTL